MAPERSQKEKTPPYLLSKPKALALMKAWEEYWTNYVLKMAEEEGLNMIGIVDLRRRQPFNRMDETSFNELIKTLIRRGYAKLWNRKHKLLRIYWCSPSYWVERLIEAVKARRVTSVVAGIEDVTQLVPEMSSLPKEELKEVLKLMVQQGLAEWLDKKRLIIRVT